MPYSPDELADRLKKEGDSVVAYFQGLSPEQWEQVIYGSEGAWRARDVLGHLIAAEGGHQELIQNVAGGGEGVDEHFQVDEYNQRTVDALRGQERGILLGQYAMVRERTAAIVRGLAPEQLENTGRHPYLGQITLEAMIRAIYHHNSLHLRDVAAALRNPGVRPETHTGAVS
jgi:hypothetical protein